MNPLTNVKNITKLNETELSTGLIHKKSWHDMYKESAWIFIGGLEYGLTEGDVIAVFSQYGEVENINLVRDKKTGKSKGYCFLCFSNQKSTVLAVDNFNGIKLCNRTIRVDHVANYKPPKENERDDEITKVLKSEGCAPQVVQKIIAKETPDAKNDGTAESKMKKKKSKKEKKKKKRKHKTNSDASDKETCVADEVKVKKERHDPGYDKYDTSAQSHRISNKGHNQRRVDCSNDEYSYSDRSRISTPYIKSEKNDNLNMYKAKFKTEPESDRDDYSQADRDSAPSREREQIKSRTESQDRRNMDSRYTSSKKHKRKRSSSSSDDSMGKAADDRKKYKLKNDDSKRSLKRKKKSKNVSDTSSSDEASSSQSSSEDEEHDGRYSNKDKHKMHYETIRSNREDDQNRSYDRSGDSYSSSRSKHYEKAEKHFEHTSKTDYREYSRDDRSYKDSRHHKRKSNK